MKEVAVTNQRKPKIILIIKVINSPSYSMFSGLSFNLQERTRLIEILVDNFREPSFTAKCDRRRIILQCKASLHLYCKEFFDLMAK